MLRTDPNRWREGGNTGKENYRPDKREWRKTKKTKERRK